MNIFYNIGLNIKKGTYFLKGELYNIEAVFSPISDDSLISQIAKNKTSTAKNQQPLLYSQKNIHKFLASTAYK